jgi:hypothetical protein
MSRGGNNWDAHRQARVYTEAPWTLALKDLGKGMSDTETSPFVIHSAAAMHIQQAWMYVVTVQ